MRGKLKQPGKAMIHPSRRDRKTKAVAEALAMIPAAELAPYRPLLVREKDEWLEESATEFSAALDKYRAEHMPGLNKLSKRRMV
jgi:hypothetical protein